MHKHRTYHRMAQEFAENFYRKFIDKVDSDGRSLTPWRDFDFIELFGRLEEEVAELNESIMELRSLDRSKRIMDECKDVANFAWFIYEIAKDQLEDSK